MIANKNKLDCAQIFLTFMSLVGDVEKTAAALDLNPAIVAELADKEGWNAKIRRISLISKSDKPGDWERAQNRALNFVQAHRLRGVLSNMIKHFEDMEPEALSEAMVSQGREGQKTYTAKIVADLSTAMERVHQMTYSALGDTVKERESRTDEEGNSLPFKDLHAALIGALNHETFVGKEKDLLALEAEEVVKATIPDRTLDDLGAA